MLKKPNQYSVITSMDCCIPECTHAVTDMNHWHSIAVYMLCEPSIDVFN